MNNTLLDHWARTEEHLSFFRTRIEEHKEWEQDARTQWSIVFAITTVANSVIILTLMRLFNHGSSFARSALIAVAVAIVVKFILDLFYKPLAGREPKMQFPNRFDTELATLATTFGVSVEDLEHEDYDRFRSTVVLPALDAAFAEAKSKQLDTTVVDPFAEFEMLRRVCMPFRFLENTGDRYSLKR